MHRLEKRIAIVTGAAGGIGAATARRLAQEGAIVVVADRDADGAEKVAHAIGQTGANAMSIAFDLSDARSITALYDTVIAAHGRVDILHNNAADVSLAFLAQDQMIGELDVSVWDRTFATNARGTLLMTQRAIQEMLPNGGGVIVNTTSGAAARGDVYNPSYAASKAAIESLTRYVAMQYGKRGIRCNCVAPGLIETETMKGSFDPAQAKIVDRQTLTPYPGTPEHVAGTVAFLVSDDSGFITGQTLAVDGGILTHMPHAPDMAAFLSR